MNVLSLFDGISCGQLALQRLNMKIDKYYASEIDKNAIKCTQFHFPNTIQLGDVKVIDYSKLEHIDLLLGGSPCQDLSLANVINKGFGKGLKGDKSSLFFEYVKALKILSPKYFLFENVASMKKEDKDIITKELGVEPIEIDSNLVSFQNRKRLYWTNIPNVDIPKDKKINFQDFKSSDYEYCKTFKVNKTPSRLKMWGEGKNGNCPNVTNSSKINCVTCRQDRWKNSGLIEFEDFCRFLTIEELELAQTLPKGYTKMLNKYQSMNAIRKWLDS